jgi:microsomal dipeptidase-like Zn-dependent dipeptidase
MPYADLHCHPFFKPTWLPGNRPDTDIRIDIDPLHETDIRELLIKVIGTELRKILNSQSCLRQLNDAEGKLIVANLIAMENAYSNLDLCIYKSVLQYVKGMNQKQLKDAGEAKVSYFSLLEAELAVARSLDRADLGGYCYKLISDFDHVDDSPNVVNVVLAVEGGHSFYQHPDVLAQEQNPAEVIAALVDWKRAARLGQRPRLLYVTLTHHTQNCFSNHAYAVPPLFAGTGKNPRAGGFNPTGSGLTAAGREFCRKALRQTPDEDRVLIDLKHMSLKARREFYDFRRTLEAEGFAPIPLVASHMGVTGQSWNDATVLACYRLDADPKRTFEVMHNDSLRIHGFKLTAGSGENDINLLFNPWSINLYDEEIAEIVNSGGLIGLSFDDRILGNGPVYFERFSRAEIYPLPSIQSINFDSQTTENGRVSYAFRNFQQQPFHEKRYPEAPLLPGFDPARVRAHKGLLALCQNIVHTVRIGGPDTWDCLCIGSDFDGIIDAIDVAPHAGTLAFSDAPDGFRSLFTSYLGRMVGAMNRYFEDEATGETPLTLPGDAYERFMHDNLRRFLEKHFRRDATGPAILTNSTPPPGGTSGN